MKTHKSDFVTRNIKIQAKTTAAAAAAAMLLNNGHK